MNLSYYFEEIKTSCKAHKIIFFCSLLAVIAGILCGIILDKPLSLDLYYREYCSDLISVSYTHLTLPTICSV